MSKVLKSEFYRLKKQKSTYVILLVTAALAVLNTFAVGISFGNAFWIRDWYENMIYMILQTEGYQSSMLNQLYALMELQAESVTDFLSILLTSDLLLIGAVFVTCFTSSVRRHGFMKNVIGYANRQQYFLADALIGFLFIAVLEAIMMIVSYLLSGFFLEDMPVGDVLPFLAALGCALVSYYASYLCMVLIVDSSKRVNRGIILIFLYFAFGSGMITTIMNLLLTSIFKTTVSFDYFTPSGALSKVLLTDPSSMLICVVVSLIYLITVFIVELLVVCRKDQEFA